MGRGERMNQDGAAGLRRVTRDVDPDAVRDLLEHPPRATLAFTADGEVEVLPVRAVARDGVDTFGVRPERAPDLADREVVLVRDDGPYYFQLRGVTVRGVARRAPQETGELIWYAIEPRKVLAWDYGAMRDA